MASKVLTNIPKNEILQVRLRSDKGNFVITRKTTDGLFIEYEVISNGYKKVGQASSPYKLPNYTYKGD